MSLVFYGDMSDMFFLFVMSLESADTLRFMISVQ